jgi:hypothetical protein
MYLTTYKTTSKIYIRKKEDQEKLARMLRGIKTLFLQQKIKLTP